MLLYKDKLLLYMKSMTFMNKYAFYFQAMPLQLETNHIVVPKLNKASQQWSKG